ncbi:acetolactate synthase large subunit [Methylomarinum sp. Ch1-1]|uniref:Acetolactate synthase large subunit n=1 Tax=Methylomarinum roseum TaxID=3067653 RepID=A0AAU7NQU6_9GAMM|nr:acetolactate synthase large subunit [Methylomarinum sp. Ch1-1]MDP4520689.1 acetolactate synthase large subunit [Methylomarinum sp. Ch1-1]
MSTAAELLVKCLENEGVEYIFGIPGEENLHVMDALRDSKIRFITVRHEQGAAFMADVYGRLTGNAGVCLATLGPGATNLITGFADANMDRAPIVAIAGQGATTRLHKESHQVLDLVSLFKPISHYSAMAMEAENIPEITRKAFQEAQGHNPGGAFICLPENIAGQTLDQAQEALSVNRSFLPKPTEASITQAVQLISKAEAPIILAGNGVIRNRACQDLMQFAERLNIPVSQTFMAKGVIPFSHALSLGTIGLQAHDYVACGFEQADLVICIGFDMVEYHPYLWHPRRDKKIVHIHNTPAEIDAHYGVSADVVGDIALALRDIAEYVRPKSHHNGDDLKRTIVSELDAYAQDAGFPLKPQRILADTRAMLDDEDILISDVGAHKMWIARLFRCEAPNTCIISNGFASMGIGVPGAIAAKLVHPERKVLTITGDAGFMMNSQEIETALRYQIPIVIMIWNDGEYGLIKWHQQRRFGRTGFIEFNNPDFVKYAEAFGAKGYRVNAADQLLPTLKQAFADDTVVVIDVPVDYSENMRLTEKLGKLLSQS